MSRNHFITGISALALFTAAGLAMKSGARRQSQIEKQPNPAVQEKTSVEQTSTVGDSPRRTSAMATTPLDLFGKDDLHALIRQLGPNWRPADYDSQSQEFHEFLNELTKGDEEARMKFLKDQNFLSSLCPSRFLAACNQMLMNMFDDYDRLRMAAGRAAEGPQLELLQGMMQEENDRLADFGGRLCVLGVPSACHWAEHKYGAQLVGQMEAYCQSDLGDYCTSAGYAVENDDPERAYEFFNKGCYADNTSSCDKLISKNELSDDDPRKRKAVEVLERKCAPGADREIYPPPCQTLAEFYADSRDSQIAAEYALQSCTSGDRNSCMLHAEILMKEGRSDEIDRSLIGQSIRDYCEAMNENGVSPIEPNDTVCRNLSRTAVGSAEEWKQLLRFEFWTHANSRRTLEGQTPEREPANISIQVEDGNH